MGSKSITEELGLDQSGDGSNAIGFKQLAADHGATQNVVFERVDGDLALDVIDAANISTESALNFADNFGSDALASNESVVLDSLQFAENTVYDSFGFSGDALAVAGDSIAVAGDSISGVLDYAETLSDKTFAFAENSNNQTIDFAKAAGKYAIDSVAEANANALKAAGDAYSEAGNLIADTAGAALNEVGYIAGSAVDSVTSAGRDVLGFAAELMGLQSVGNAKSIEQVANATRSDAAASMDTMVKWGMGAMAVVAVALFVGARK